MLYAPVRLLKQVHFQEVGMQEALFESAEPQSSPGGWVYVIGAAESSVVKIGKAADIERRRRNLQTASPLKLVTRWATPGDRKLERWLHVEFDHLRVEGEWFDFGDKDPVAEIKAAIHRFGLPEVKLASAKLPEIYEQRVMLGPRWDYRHPRPDDPDRDNPLFQLKPCGCRYLTPAELAAKGYDPAEAGHVFIMTEHPRSGILRTLCSLHGS
jgi:hypothetical protein